VRAAENAIPLNGLLIGARVFAALHLRRSPTKLARSMKIHVPKAAQHCVRSQRPRHMHIERRNRTAWLGLGLVLLGLVAVSTLSGGMLGQHHLVGSEARPFVGAGPWFWGIGLVGLAIRFVFWGALIMLVVTLFRRSSRWSPMNVNRSQSSSLEILKQRYAAGEISREQFEEMRRVLDPTAATQ
jgi:putative membrane protein